MLPEDWKLVQLGEIAQISSGGTPDRSQVRYWNGDIPWVTTGEIQFGTISDTAEKITEEGLQNSSAKLFPPGTLLMAMYGQGKTRGQVAILGIEAATNQACAAIQLRDDVDREYVYQCLSSQYQAIRELGNAGAQQNLNAALVKGIALPLPPKSEQARIAAVARHWDTAIGLAAKLLRNAHRARQTTSQTLLSGRQRLKHNGEWSRRRLAELISESRIPGSSGVVARKLTVKLYGKGVIAKDERRRGSEATVYYRRRAGQFIYSKLDFLNGAFGVVPQHLDGYESTLDLPAFDIVNNVDPRWLLYYVSREDFYKGLFGLASGGRKARRVNPADLLQVSIECPGPTEQRAIADAIDVASEDVRKWEAMLDAFKAEKQALMADLLSGRRRVRQAESSVDLTETA